MLEPTDLELFKRATTCKLACNCMGFFFSISDDVFYFDSVSRLQIEIPSCPIFDLLHFLASFISSWASCDKRQCFEELMPKASSHPYTYIIVGKEHS